MNIYIKKMMHTCACQRSKKCMQSCTVWKKNDYVAGRGGGRKGGMGRRRGRDRQTEAHVTVLHSREKREKKVISLWIYGHTDLNITTSMLYNRKIKGQIFFSCDFVVSFC